MAACKRCGFDELARVLASWAFFVARNPPSLNDRIVNSREGGHRYRKERDLWIMEVRIARMNLKIPAAKARRRVTLVRSYSGRAKERDLDNLVGGMKCVVDSLAFERLLLSDAPRDAEIHYAQLQRTPSGLTITIEDLA